jgi:5-methylcytosine-specific restriction endonuclease McrA
VYKIIREWTLVITSEKPVYNLDHTIVQIVLGPHHATRTENHNIATYGKSTSTHRITVADGYNKTNHVKPRKYKTSMLK